MDTRRPPGQVDHPPGLEGRITVHQLRLLVAVVERGGVTRAAEALRLSQPAVSHQMTSLAASIGLPLLDIVGRRVVLTEAGEVLHGHALRVLAEFDAATRSMDELRGLSRGRLRVIGDTTVGIYVLPDVLGDFRERHPTVDVRLEIGNRQHVSDRLFASEVDFAISGRPWLEPERPVESTPFLANQLIAIASPRHPLARRRRIPLARLAAEPFIVREAGSGTRETAEEAFEQAGLPIRPVMELASNGAIKRAVSRGLGVSILSRYAAALEIELGLLVELPVIGFPLRRQWHLVRLRERRLGPAGEAFLRFVEAGDWRSRVGHPLATE